MPNDTMRRSTERGSVQPDITRSQTMPGAQTTAPVRAIHPVPKPSRVPKPVTPVKQRNTKRGGHAFPKLVSTGRRAFCRKQRCIATGARTGDVVFAQSWMPETLRSLCPYVAKVIVAHVKSRGSGGADESNIVPLERMVHELQGQKGWPWLLKVCRLMAPAEIAAEQETKFLARCAAIARNLESR